MRWLFTSAVIAISGVFGIQQATPVVPQTLQDMNASIVEQRTLDNVARQVIPPTTNANPSGAKATVVAPANKKPSTSNSVPAKVSLSPNNFSAAPTSGSVPLTAPLTLIFHQSTGLNCGHLAVDFGDGIGVGVMTYDPISDTEGVCETGHTYFVPGVYHAQLMENSELNLEWRRQGKQVTVTVGNPIQPINCPVHSPPPPCPSGQHYIITAPATRDSRDCWLPPTQQCVRETPGPFSASPTSGSAPLTVRFSGLGSVIDSQIDFGDGSIKHWDLGSAPPAYTDYTYTSAGTYYVRLLQLLSGSCDDIPDGGPVSPCLAPSIMITVR